MSITMTSSSPARKQLADQLDRFDAILDGLADALNGAVADASREGARAAVKELAAELLAHPDFHAVIRAATRPEPPVRTTNRLHGFLSVVASAVGSLKMGVRAVATRVSDVVRLAVRKLTGLATAGREAAQSVRRIAQASPVTRKAVLIGVGFGVAVAVVAATSHTLAAVLSGTGAAIVATGVQIGLRLRAVLRGLQLA